MQQLFATILMLLVSMKSIDCFTTSFQNVQSRAYLSILNSVQSEIIINRDIQLSNDERDYFSSCYPERNPIFEKSNVMSYSMPTPSSSFINTIAPPLQKDVWRRFSTAIGYNNITSKKKRIGCDVIVQFQDAKKGATDIVQKCLSKFEHNIDAIDIIETESSIANILSLYQDHIVSETKEEDIPFSYKARIVSSIGSSGQKCPRWHVDHVPLRLVMSLQGPGCVYIPIEKEQEWLSSVNREALNESEEPDTMKANISIVPLGEKNIAVYAKKGDAVLLMGRAWEKDKNIESSSDLSYRNSILAAPHRSPEIGDDELRVLLVVDVVPKTE